VNNGGCVETVNPRQLCPPRAVVIRLGFNHGAGYPCQNMSATNRGAIRRESDFYATPLSAFTPLLPYLDKTAHHWEPACGDGRLVDSMRQHDIDCDGTDLNSGHNFLESTRQVPVIITNPPYSLAFEFCVKAVTLAPEVWMLLRLNFLASQKRRTWFIGNEPSALFVLSHRPCFTDDGKTDATDYGWYFWGSRHKGIIHL